MTKYTIENLTKNLSLKNNIDTLVEGLQFHRNKYNAGTPLISDIDFDKMEANLKDLDPNNSYFTKVGVQKSILKKVFHSPKMLSLDKLYESNQVYTKLNNNILIGVPKLDGCSLELEYNKAGEFTRASTRGNGTEGEDVTHIMEYCPNFPRKINIPSFKVIKVRGEVLLPLKDFNNLNKKLSEEDQYKNARNAMAGLLGLKTPSQKHIDFINKAIVLTYHIVNQISNEYLEDLNILKNMKFAMPPMIIAKNNNEVKNFFNNYVMNRKESPFEIDGIVWTINNKFKWKELGETSHHPRWAIALKFEAEQEETVILDIEYSMGKTGIITPVAIVEPIELTGVTVSRCSLHNFKNVKDMEITIGATVKIQRSGDVIPYMTAVTKFSSNELIVPKICPVCKQ